MMRFRLFIFHLINLNLNWGFGVLIAQIDQLINMLVVVLSIWLATSIVCKIVRKNRPLS